MNLIWWFVWILLLVWIFVIPYDIPGQRSKKESPLDLLKKRYAAGEIEHSDYLERKKNLQE